MQIIPYLLHALSPLHAGTGHTTDIIDLPIARMRSTGIPIVPGSSIKGVLRDVRTDQDSEKAQAVFGPEKITSNDDAFAGALIVSDARLLALPVRSFNGTFAWVTSPLLLSLAVRDLEGVAFPKVPEVDPQTALVSAENVNVHDQKLYLEDLDLSVKKDCLVDQWSDLFAALVMEERPQGFSSRFVIIDDETMTFLWETATQVDTRIRLDPTTRTVADGAMWLEESLPPETLLIGTLAAHGSSRQPEGERLSPQAILEFALPAREVLQFGGKASVGRGRCQMMPFSVASGGK